MLLKFLSTERVVFWAERTLGGIDRGVDRGDLFSRSILALKIPEHRKGGVLG